MLPSFKIIKVSYCDTAAIADTTIIFWTNKKLYEIQVKIWKEEKLKIAFFGAVLHI